MQNSSADMVGFVAVLNMRYIPGIGEKLLKKGGGEYSFPKRIHELLLLARTFHERYRKNNFRHDPKEAMQLKELADWLLRQDRALKGQQDAASRESFDFDSAALSSATPLPENSYWQCCNRVKNDPGWAS